MDLFYYLEMRECELKSFFDDKKYIISISGMDNVGKTTQANMLNDLYPNIFSPPIHINQMEEFPKLKGKELSKWWFNKENAQEFVNTIYKCCVQRYEMSLKMKQPIIVFDKGLNFYDIRVKATLITMGFKEEEIIEMINTSRKVNQVEYSKEKLRIIITAENRDFMKEKGINDDKQYERYIIKNIELLNKELKQNNNQIYSEVKYINNNKEYMHERIIEQIADLIRKEKGINIKDLQNQRKINNKYLDEDFER
ncbi:MAG: hypothetical protein Q4G05_06415 [Clostridia bacterium]|nr:hypothetical protein [Clostridia bacterium]